MSIPCGKARTRRRKYDRRLGFTSQGTVQRWCRGSSRVRSLIGPALGVMLDRCNPPGAVVDAVLEAATHARRAERTADGGVMSVPQVLHVSRHAPRMNAQRVARFDRSCIRNCVSPKALRWNIQEV